MAPKRPKQSNEKKDFQANAKIQQTKLRARLHNTSEKQLNNVMISPYRQFYWGMGIASYPGALPCPKW